MNFDYHDKKFAAVSNSEHGEVNPTTIFHYTVEGTILKGTYEGGEIVSGHILGVVHEAGDLEFLYHHLNIRGELKAGQCKSRPEILPNGSIRLYEIWQWFDENKSNGTSVLEEILE